MFVDPTTAGYRSSCNFSPPEPCIEPAPSDGPLDNLMLHRYENAKIMIL